MTDTEQDIYQDLQKHLDQFPILYPSTMEDLYSQIMNKKQQLRKK